MENTIPISVTLPAPLVWGLVVIVVLFVASALVFISMPKDGDARPLKALRESLGLGKLHPIPFMVLLAFYTILASVLALGLLGMVIEVIAHAIPTRRLPATVWDFRFKLVQITALTTVLGAVIALPLTVIRLRLTQKQTDTATESLFNEKINAATEGLYARRQISEEHGDKGYVDRWQDDIIQRCAAIDRLEGLAQEKSQDVPRIARLLSVYVRELSAEVRPVTAPEKATPDELRKWARALPKLRSDMEKATQTLGRLHKYAPDPLNGDIDLRGANLQRADLSGLKFDKAVLYGAQLQGAALGSVQLQGANLLGAQFQGADLFGAQLQGANLSRAQLQGADLIGATMDGDTSLRAASLQGAAVKNVDYKDVAQIMALLGDIFGDASVELPDGIAPGHPDWPKHWSQSEQPLDLDDFKDKWHAWQATLPFGWDKPDP